MRRVRRRSCDCRGRTVSRSSDTEHVRAVVITLDRVRDQLLGGYATARASAIELAARGYPTTASGSADRVGTSSNTISDPTARAALEQRTRAANLDNELEQRLRALDRAVVALGDSLTFAERVGLTGARPAVCAVCGHMPTGIGNDRLRRQLCVRHYAADRAATRERAADAEVRI